MELPCTCIWCKIMFTILLWMFLFCLFGGIKHEEKKVSVEAGGLTLRNMIEILLSIVIDWRFWGRFCLNKVILRFLQVQHYRLYIHIDLSWQSEFKLCYHSIITVLESDIDNRYVHRGKRSEPDVQYGWSGQGQNTQT